MNERPNWPENRQLDPPFRCAACGRVATWLVAGTSSCGYHRGIFAAVAAGRLR